MDLKVLQFHNYSLRILRESSLVGILSMVRKHVVITGTGRAGTTFLVQLLTQLGLDTGFNSADTLNVNPISHAGLEYDIREDGAPYIVKSPWFCHYAAEVFERPDISIDHIFIPMRDLYQAAESRRLVSRMGAMSGSWKARAKRQFFKQLTPGGLMLTNRPRNQEKILLEHLYSLLLAVSQTTIPVTLLCFPRFVSDCHFLYQKLQPLIGGETTFGEFENAYQNTVQPNLVHTHV